ncbi:sensor histidine kinase [Phyllobacterium lublinensis]|uniref:sensor histidine kinase n=1 Tax=Phyllobacterium lublinensis TaxID=2875708 RepID=UPI001CCC55D6|nr:CHASE3 domain-containing protein [Phyllobacterium sp. 2063]MBZ9653658.1 CHASE3 domain-containing protein [Phyllobacterium sp. 2063]
MFAFAVALLLGIVGSSLWLVQANREYSEETAQLRRLRSSIVAVLSTMQDAETGQRGFLLTNDPAYLEPFTKAVEALPERRNNLTANAASRPSYSSKLGALNEAMDAKMLELTHTVELAKADRLREAITQVGTDVGRYNMDQIRSILADFLDQTDKRLIGLVADQLSAASKLQWTTSAGAIAIFVALGCAAWIIFRYIRDLARARELVLKMNLGLEARVDERTEDLMRANQEIQRFAYIVTHDLRAPLVNIMGFLSELDSAAKMISTYVLADAKTLSQEQILSARAAVEEDLPEALTFIRASTKKMDALINAILKISRDGRRKLQPEDIELKHVLETAAANIHHQLAEFDGSIDIKGHYPVVTTDRFSLDQIIGNLFDNAVKYRAPGRPLRIKVEAHTDGPGRARIDVIDNGRGIADHDRERVFELFRRAGDQDQPGEGIGLAYTRSLIRNLGGDITVKSELGHGSTFSVTLPTNLGNNVTWRTDL